MYICTPENIQNPKVTGEKVDHLDYIQNLKIIHGKNKETNKTPWGKSKNKTISWTGGGGIVIHMIVNLPHKFLQINRKMKKVC